MKLVFFLPLCVIASRLDRFLQYHSRKSLKNSNKAPSPELLRLLREEQIILGLSKRPKSVSKAVVISANARRRRNRKYLALNYRSKSFKGKYDLDFGTNALSSYFD